MLFEAMGVAQLTLITIVGFSAIFFLVRNRIDFVLLMFASTILYHWQIVAGQIWVPPFTFAASNQAMWVLSLVLVVILLAALVHDQLWQSIPAVAVSRIPKSDNVLIGYILAGFSIVGMFYAIGVAGDVVLSGNKNEFTNKLALPYDIFYYFPAAMALLIGTLYRRSFLIFVAAIPLMFYLIIGYRAVFVTALVGAFTISAFGERILQKKLLGYIILAILVFVFFVVYKFSYIAIKTGGFDWFASLVEGDSRFDDIFEFLLWAMFSAEFGQVASNLSLSAELNRSADYAISNVFVTGIPGAGSALGISEDEVRFSRVIRAFANPGFSYGLGSSLWGEFYFAGGLPLVFIGVTAIAGSIAFFNLQLKSNPEGCATFLMFFSFLAFYSHRNDLTLVLGHFKNHVFLLCSAILVLFLLRGKVALMGAGFAYRHRL